MQLSRGLVIVVPDPRVRPKNRLKWHICVSPERRLFLRINSKPKWAPYHFIRAAKNPFLERDSYVELISLFFFSESELRAAKRIGEMPPPEQLALADAAQEAVTLTQEQKDIVWENFGV